MHRPPSPDTICIPLDLPPTHTPLPVTTRSLLCVLSPSLTSLTVPLPFPSIFLFCWPPPPPQQDRNSGNWCAWLHPPTLSTPSCPHPPSCAGRESWFYLFFCLFGKRAGAVLGPGCCALPRAVGRRAALASQECGRDAPRYIYFPPAAGPSRAEPGLPGGPGGALCPPSPVRQTPHGPWAHCSLPSP